jgi:FG-GAP-like repeat
VTHQPSAQTSTRTPLLGIAACAAFVSAAPAQIQLDPPVVYPIGSAPSAVLAVDLDNDNDLDLVGANRLTHNISVSFNNGDGTFGVATFFPSHAGPEVAGPRSLTHTDLDGDGDQDIIAVNQLLNNIVVLFNDGTGTLSSPLPIAVFNKPTDIEPVDIDNDGDLDFAVAHNGSSTGPVAVLRNNGFNAGLWLGFAPIERYAVGAGCRAVAAGDFDGDNDQDLVACNRESATVSVLLNDGTGTYTLKEHLAVPVQPREVSIQDLDGDGTPDLAVADFNNGFVHLLTNAGGVGRAWLGFNAPLSIPGGGLGPHSITTADFDLDGDNDLAMGNVQSANVALFENLGSMQFGVQLIASGAFSTAEVIAHDVNGDCEPDLITSNSATSGSLSVMINRSATCPCFADCDQSTGVGTLDIFDFLCFQSSFVAGQTYACDCDTSTGIGVCDIFDFLCFQSAFVGGCP